VVLLVAMLSGSLFSLVALPETTSVGASGGLMGLLGLLVVAGFRAPRALPPQFGRGMVHGVVWVAATGLTAYAFIDNAAHAGGLLAGVGLGFALVPRDAALPLPAGSAMRTAGAAALAVLTLAWLACGAAILRPA
jgi:membrane associated rhomboid family serine protease